MEENLPSFTVVDTEQSKRLLEFVYRRFSEQLPSKALAKKAISMGAISISGKVCTTGSTFVKGETVTLTLTEPLQREMFSMKELSVVWEDEHLALIWKPSGVPVGVPTREGKTMANFVKFNLQTPSAGWKEGLPFCHNFISKSVIGFVLVSKTEKAKQKLTLLFQNKGEGQGGEDAKALPLRLIFSAIASGQLPIKVGQELKIAKPLLSAEDEQTENKEKLAEFTEANIPVTVCRLLKVSQSNSIDQLCTVELEPLNPVNVNYLLIHQPTRHMESANCPVVGISKFMKQPKSSCRGSGSFIALTSIHLTHPITGERIVVSKEEPSKFESLRKKEQSFWEKKKKKNEEDLHQEIKSDIPIAYLRGDQEFFGLKFSVKQGIFIPRKGTEVLVSAVLKYAADFPSNCGVGSGCLLLSCLYNLPGTVGVGIDISTEALNIASKNANKLGIGPNRAIFLECAFDKIPSLWKSNHKRKREPNENTKSVQFPNEATHFEKKHKPNNGEYTAAKGKSFSPSDPATDTGSDLEKPNKFDIIVCNPPYFTPKMAGRVLDPAVLKYEPKEAYLTNDDDGLEGYRQVIKSIKEANDGKRMSFATPLLNSCDIDYAGLLVEGGFLVFEIGKGMNKKVLDLIKNEPSGWLSTIEVLKDPISKTDRCVVCKSVKR